MVNLGSIQIHNVNKLRDNEYKTCMTPESSKAHYDVHKNHNHLPHISHIISVGQITLEFFIRI
jgi:hypothetical protein